MIIHKNKDMKRFAKIKTVKESYNKLEDLTSEETKNTDGGSINPFFKGIILLCYGTLIPTIKL
jgi:hypothetical protein